MIKADKSDFKYKGWFFACPIYLNLDDDENGAEVAARYEWLEWWFTVNSVICNFMIGLKSMLDPDYEPAFPFRITGEIKDEQ